MNAELIVALAMYREAIAQYMLAGMHDHDAAHLAEYARNESLARLVVIKQADPELYAHITTLDAIEAAHRITRDAFPFHGHGLDGVCLTPVVMAQ